MNQSFSHLARIREVVERLLEQLNLEAYLYYIEPKEGQWELTVECVINDGWETIKLRANKEYFLHGQDDAIIHDLLLNESRETLAGCHIKNPNRSNL